MGFRKDAWATVWGVEAKSDTVTSVRLSTSRKDRQSDEYVQDFSGFVTFFGTAAAKKAACLKEKDRIKLGDVEVTTSYDANSGKTYTNFKCFNFTTQGEQSDTDTSTDSPSPRTTEPQPTVDEGVDDDKLPF